MKRRPSREQIYRAIDTGHDPSPEPVSKRILPRERMPAAGTKVDVTRSTERLSYTLLTTKVFWNEPNSILPCRFPTGQIECVGNDTYSFVGKAGDSSHEKSQFDEKTSMNKKIFDKKKIFALTDIGANPDFT